MFDRNPNVVCRVLWLCGVCLAVLAGPAAGDAQTDAAADADQAIIQAFAETHRGLSSDEVILQAELNRRFLRRCREKLARIEPGDGGAARAERSDARINWRLLNLRKAGKLTVPTTRRDQRDYRDALILGEIAARTMTDKHRKSIDRVLADPELRDEFDQLVLEQDRDIDPYLARKAAFALRKSRRLRPELITRIADWGRVVTEHRAQDLAEDLGEIPAAPGIYIFRDATGYLYIGESADLRARLRQHLDESDRRSLAHYLKQQELTGIVVEVHAFDPQSRAREVRVRRAYESELIRSRKPRFNLQP